MHRVAAEALTELKNNLEENEELAEREKEMQELKTLEVNYTSVDPKQFVSLWSKPETKCQTVNGSNRFSSR